MHAECLLLETVDDDDDFQNRKRKPSDNGWRTIVPERTKNNILFSTSFSRQWKGSEGILKTRLIDRQWQLDWTYQLTISEAILSKLAKRRKLSRQLIDMLIERDWKEDKIRTTYYQWFVVMIIDRSKWKSLVFSFSLSLSFSLCLSCLLSVFLTLSGTEHSSDYLFHVCIQEAEIKSTITISFDCSAAKDV